MKILALGDFQGKFPMQIKKIIHKERIDIVVSNGDYFPFYLRKLFFKHIFGKRDDIELWDIIGKGKYAKIMQRELKSGESVLKNLDKLNVPVLTVVGNLDHNNKSDIHDAVRRRRFGLWRWSENSSEWKWAEQDFFSSIVKKYKNNHRIDYSYFQLDNCFFIGMNGHSFPGRVKSRAFRKSKKKLEELFKKIRRKNKNAKIVFVSHNIVYNTKLDKIHEKGHKLVRGAHFGSKLARRIIDQLQPDLHIGGHIHEGRGKQYLGKTLCVNPGAVHEGKCAVIEMRDGGNKISVKFKRFGK